MSEEQARKEAEKLIKEAEGHLASKSSFFGLFSSGPDYYEAIDAYNRAGNAYKSAKLCKCQEGRLSVSNIYRMILSYFILWVREGSW